MPAPNTIQEQQESVKNMPSQEDFYEQLKKTLERFEEEPKEEELSKEKPSQNN